MLWQLRKILHLLLELRDNHSNVLLFNSPYLMLHILLYPFAKPSSGSTNYAKKVHPAQYIIYVLQAVVNSKLRGNL